MKIDLRQSIAAEKRYVLLIMAAIALVMGACMPIAPETMALPDMSDTTPETTSIDQESVDEETLPFAAAYARMDATIGVPVQNLDGERLGQIEDYMLDLSVGEVLYAIVTFDALTDLDENLVPVPFEFLRFHLDDDLFLLNVNDASIVGNAPSYAVGALPETQAASAWDTSVRTYWQNAVLPTPAQINTDAQPVIAPYYRYGTGVRVLPNSTILFSALKEQAFASVENDVIGEVSDLVVNLASGDTPYLVVLLEPAELGAVFINESMALTPLGTMTWNAADGSLIFELTPETFEQAPRFAPEGWPNLTDHAWIGEVQTYWHDVDVATALRTGMRILPDTVMRASDFIGRDVTNAAGEDLGTIEDIVINTENGDLSYAILQLGGFLGIGDAFHVVPLSSLTLGQMAEMAFLGIEQETLENSPTLPTDALSAITVPGWEQPFRDYWQDWVLPSQTADADSDATAAQVSPVPVQMPYTTFAGFTVQNQEGENLGEVEDVMLNLTQGRAAYAVLSFGGFLDIGDKLFAIPMDLLTPDLDPENETVNFNVEQELLTEMPGFDSDNWPDTANPVWDEEVRAYWRDYF